MQSMEVATRLAGSANGRLASFVDRLSQPVSVLSLVAFRIALGALLVWDWWRFVKYDRIFRYYVLPDFHFTYPGFGWVTPLPEPWIYLAWATVGASALLVMLGLFYRVSIIVLTLSFTYFFLLDQAEYLNHFYLIILFLILMCFLPANRAYSLDTWLWPKWRSETVPYASVFILRAQMEIMLVFAGLVKLTPDWLAGEPLGIWLRRQADLVPLGWLFHFDWVIIAGTWGTIVLHVVGAPLLLWRRTRLPVFIIYCIFHTANGYFFNIGIFPWVTIAATTIFFAPDWPRHVAQRIPGIVKHLPAQLAPSIPPSRTIPTIAMIGIALWLAVQIALPLRGLAFPTEVRWSGDGHQFSWRMRIFDREAVGRFYVAVPPDGPAWRVDPVDYLTPRQASKMLVRSDMVHQFAGHLERVWQAAGYGDVEVRAHILKSLNGRPRQPFIDPDVDMTEVRVNLFGPDDWVLPLCIPVWGVADNRTAEPGPSMVDCRE